MLRLYNSLTRKIEDFNPINPQHVGMYTCGPTVYDFAHIGNFRTYTNADLLLRVLRYNGLEVNYVMNITDVGHLTGDNLGDADFGDDRMEKSAQKEGKTAWEVARFYTDAFLEDFKKLNLIQPTVIANATDNIKEQIDLVLELESRGYTYKTSDGVYFDTSRFKDYGKLSNLDQIREGARVDVNPEKRNPRDFALWKFSPSEGSEVSKRQMEWDSPWGIGFPGWHIECSAMALKYLTEAFANKKFHPEKSQTIDLHVGGIDLRETHHPNEIAQSEAATNNKFVNYWMHSAFVLVKGERMSKSLGNNYKIYDLEKEGYDALVLRYLYLQTHYRQELNFSFESLDASKNALNKLREFVIKNDTEAEVDISSGKEALVEFRNAINDDLNMSKALSILWIVFSSELTNTVKARIILEFDKVLGLDLKNAQLEKGDVDFENLSQEIRHLIEVRNSLRGERKYKDADVIREKIRKLGFELDDSEKGVKIKKIRR